MVAYMVSGSVLTITLAFKRYNVFPDLYMSAFIITVISSPSILLLIVYMVSRRIRESFSVSLGGHRRLFVCLLILSVLLPVCTWIIALLRPQHDMDTLIGSIFLMVCFAACGSISKLLWFNDK